MSFLSRKLWLKVSSPAVARISRTFPNIPAALSALELQTACSDYGGFAEERDLRTRLNMLYFNSSVVEIGLSFWKLAC